MGYGLNSIKTIAVYALLSYISESGKELFMSRRRWTAEQKFAIVLQGIKGETTVAQLCRDHGISQVQYYQWRDQFFAGAKQNLNGKRTQNGAPEKAKIKELVHHWQADGHHRDTKKNSTDGEGVADRVHALTQSGYTVTAACKALGVSRSSCYRKVPAPCSHTADRDRALLDRIQQIRCDHPFWGYRRITAWFRRRCNVHVNRKRVYRIMREHNLTVKRKQYQAKRTPQRSKPKPTRVNQWWGIDMTKFCIDRLGWVYMVVLLDWYTRKIVGYHIGLQSKSADWLTALDMAVKEQCPEGAREYKLHLMSDNGSQPTSVSFINACVTLNIEQAFTSYNNPKGNANTERVIRTLKEDCIWINEWESLNQAQQTIKQWIYDYNYLYPHSALDDLSPVEFELQNTNLNAA